MDEKLLVGEARSAADAIDLKGFPYTAAVLRDCAETIQRLISRAALTELIQLDQEMGLYDAGPTPFRGRQTRREE